MLEAKIVGGTDADRRAVLEKHQEYLDANARFDWERLRDHIWSAASDTMFFNLNGHTYRGRDHWVRLWQYYIKQMSTGVWVPFDIGGTISGDLAVVWCHRKTKLRWVGSDQRPDDKQHDDKDFISRSTMVFQRESGEWRVLHVHFSEANPGDRPGGI
ncbi:MAG: YybH family protein [Burkholderiales bacterium]